ncbi:MAG: hypothetical protein E7056_01720 [Lentisphaerae bacterium]|nr:hypothetical protein [Lentisphaerota bacterium]MBR3943872.1 hypothetical protein [Akkermansia sp.]
MFKSESIVKIILGVLLAIIGFYSAQTFYSIKALEKEVVTIRVKLAEFEAKRISREEIRNLIADYHDNHPCYFIKKERSK